MRIVNIGYVVHLTSITTGEQWYSGEIGVGKPDIYKDRADAQWYASLFYLSRILATIEEHEYNEGEDNA